MTRKLVLDASSSGVLEMAVTCPANERSEPSGTREAAWPTATSPMSARPTVATTSNPPSPSMMIAVVDEPAVTSSPTAIPTDTTVPAIGLTIVAWATACSATGHLEGRGVDGLLEGDQVRRGWRGRAGHRAPGGGTAEGEDGEAADGEVPVDPAPEGTVVLGAAAVAASSPSRASRAEAAAASAVWAPLTARSGGQHRLDGGPAGRQVLRRAITDRPTDGGGVGQGAVGCRQGPVDLPLGPQHGLLSLGEAGIRVRRSPVPVPVPTDTPASCTWLVPPDTSVADVALAPGVGEPLPVARRWWRPSHRPAPGPG